MTGKIRNWWGSLPTIQQALWAAAILIGIGVTIGAVSRTKIVAYWGLPDSVAAQMIRMEAVEESHGELTVQVERNTAVLDSILAKVEAVADTSGLTWCVVRAQALGMDPFRVCTLDSHEADNGGG